MQREWCLIFDHNHWGGDWKTAKKKLVKSSLKIIKDWRYLKKKKKIPNRCKSHMTFWQHGSVLKEILRVGACSISQRCQILSAWIAATSVQKRIAVMQEKKKKEEIPSAAHYYEESIFLLWKIRHFVITGRPLSIWEKHLFIMRKHGGISKLSISLLWGKCYSFKRQHNCHGLVEINHYWLW